MRQLIVLIGFVLLGVTVQAQILKPAKWSFTALRVKGKAGMYEVHMTATIDKGWKTYSQSTPEDGPSPTVVMFKPNPLVLLGGKVKEVGELHKIDEPAFGVQVWYYKEKVDFVQVVKLKKPGVKTSLSGTVEFMVCDDHQCLPVEEIPFIVELK
jgi:hypothetical protein